MTGNAIREALESIRVGDLVRVVANVAPNHPHQFPIGTVLPVQEIHEDGSGVDLGEWACRLDEVERVPAYDAIGSGVKALEWGGDEFPQAECSFGLYQIVEPVEGGFIATRSAYPFHEDVSETLPTVAQAKAAAQADFERRVLSCLSPHTSAGAGPVGEDYNPVPVIQEIISRHMRAMWEVEDHEEFPEPDGYLRLAKEIVAACPVPLGLEDAVHQAVLSLSPVAVEDPGEVAKLRADVDRLSGLVLKSSHDVATFWNPRCAELRARSEHLETALRRSQRALIALPDTSLEVADCISANRAVLAAAPLVAVEEADAKAVAWRDMASAPKDGTVIWLYQPHDVGGFMFAGAINADGVWINNLDLKVQDPTHWMPLPATPGSVRPVEEPGEAVADARDEGWQPIETAPTGGKFGCFLMLAFGPPGDQTVSEGMHFQGRFYAASVFYTGGPHDTKQFAFREHEVKPTHWRHTLAAPGAARPVEEPGEVERLTRERNEATQMVWRREVERDKELARANTAEAALAEARERLEKVEAVAVENGRAGVEAAARYVEALRNAHTKEFGIYDPSTNATEFSGASEDIDCLYQELIEGIRSLDTARVDRARAALTGDAQEAGR